MTKIFGTDLGTVEFLLLSLQRVTRLLLLDSDSELGISGASWLLSFCCVTHGTAVVVAIGKSEVRPLHKCYSGHRNRTSTDIRKLIYVSV